MNAEETSLDSGRLFSSLRRQAPWILLCVVLCTGAAYGYAKHKTRRYTATAALAFSNNQLPQQIAGLATNNDLTPQAQQQADVEDARVGDMAAVTARLLGRGLTPETVAADVAIGGKGESSIISVAATSATPRLAAEIANTYADQIVIEQRSANRRFFKSALALVNKQLARLTPAERFGADALDLQDRAHTLALLAGLASNSVQVTGEAAVPASPSSPKVTRDAVLGALLGLFLGLAVAFVFERFDHRIRESEDFESIYRLPVIDTVPRSAALGGRATLPAAEAEVFNLIRAHLRFFNIDRELRTLVIASAAPGDGKTTIARHLAEAAARLGARVLLMEGDLRQPTLAAELQIEPGPGLAGALVGAVSTEEAIQRITLHVPPGEGASGRFLDVLLAGDVLPPNPGELLDSRAMDTLLDRTKSEYDLVVIDTPPLTAVSDALPLLTKVDGVLIVGRIGHSRYEAAEQLHQVLANSGAPLLGIIANYSKSGRPNPYPVAGNSPILTSANGASAEEFAHTTRS